MPIDSFGRYVATHKTWDHVGNLVPDVEYSEGERPHGEFKPAAWLPVQFFDKYYEVWYTIMPGKILAFDNDGRVVPAQYGLAGAQVTYTANDVAAGVIDIRTGTTLLAGAVGTFNIGTVSGFMGGTLKVAAVSHPVGVSPYAVFQWAGDAGTWDDGTTPAGLRQHNHQLQHRVALLCDYVLELPLVPAATSTEALENSSWANSHVVFSALSNLPVAKNTATTTPITFADNSLTDSATRFVNEIATVSGVTALGDWNIDLRTGVITAYAASDPGGGATAYSVNYYNYASAPTGSNVSKFACALGDLKAGDFLKCNADSNWVEATTVLTGSSTTGDEFNVIMGQVLEVEDISGKSGLDKVRTAFSPAIQTDATGGLPGGTTSGQLDQMPGSATGGVTDKVHYAGAANLVVRINLLSR